MAEREMEGRRWGSRGQTKHHIDFTLTTRGDTVSFELSSNNSKQLIVIIKVDGVVSWVDLEDFHEAVPPLSAGNCFCKIFVAVNPTKALFFSAHRSICHSRIPARNSQSTSRYSL